MHGLSPTKPVKSTFYASYRTGSGNIYIADAEGPSYVPVVEEEVGIILHNGCNHDTVLELWVTHGDYKEIYDPLSTCRY